jgi:hypothetical protein
VVAGKLEVINEGVVFPANLPTNLGSFSAGCFVVKTITFLRSRFLDPVKAPNEVEVPPAAAEFAVSHGVKAGSFFFLD